MYIYNMTGYYTQTSTLTLPASAPKKCYYYVGPDPEFRIWTFGPGPFLGFICLMWLSCPHSFGLECPGAEILFLNLKKHGHISILRTSEAAVVRRRNVRNAMHIHVILM